jgi:hypothetical protein
LPVPSQPIWSRLLPAWCNLTNLAKLFSDILIYYFSSVPHFGSLSFLRLQGWRHGTGVHINVWIAGVLDLSVSSSTIIWSFGLRMQGTWVHRWVHDFIVCWILIAIHISSYSITGLLERYVPTSPVLLLGRWPGKLPTFRGFS